VFNLADVRCVLYETKGGLTLGPRQQGSVPPLVQHGLNVSVGYRPAED